MNQTTERGKVIPINGHPVIGDNVPVEAVHQTREFTLKIPPNTDDERVEELIKSLRKGGITATCMQRGGWKVGQKESGLMGLILGRDRDLVIDIPIDMPEEIIFNLAARIGYDLKQDDRVIVGDESKDVTFTIDNSDLPEEFEALFKKEAEFFMKETGIQMSKVDEELTTTFIFNLPLEANESAMIQLGVELGMSIFNKKEL